MKRRLILKTAETLGPLVIGALGGSLRAQILPRDFDRERRGPVIFSFWHGRMLIPSFTHRGRGVGILISIHRDGEYIARVVDRMGFKTIRGSSTRGGVPGLKGMLRLAERGCDVAFTPDGPRGPRYRVQPGVIYAASRTGLPVVPCAVEANPAWVLNSWDEFTIPKPAGSTRILFFGDSCTQQGLPRTVATRLNRLGGLAPLGRAQAGDAEAQPVEAINFGVSGYSSHQGLVLAERWTERLEADAARFSSS